MWEKTQIFLTKKKLEKIYVDICPLQEVNPNAFLLFLPLNEFPAKTRVWEGEGGRE